MFSYYTEKELTEMWKIGSSTCGDLLLKLGLCQRGSACKIGSLDKGKRNTDSQAKQHGKRTAGGPPLLLVGFLGMVLEEVRADLACGGATTWSSLLVETG